MKFILFIIIILLAGLLIVWLTNTLKGQKRGEGGLESGDETDEGGE